MKSAVFQTRGYKLSWTKINCTLTEIFRNHMAKEKLNALQKMKTYFKNSIDCGETPVHLYWENIYWINIYSWINIIYWINIKDDIPW